MERKSSKKNFMNVPHCLHYFTLEMSSTWNMDYEWNVLKHFIDVQFLLSLATVPLCAAINVLRGERIILWTNLNKSKSHFRCTFFLTFDLASVLRHMCWERHNSKIFIIKSPQIISSIYITIWFAINFCKFYHR